MPFMFGSRSTILKKLKGVTQRYHTERVNELKSQIERYKEALIAVVEASNGTVIIGDDKVFNQISVEGPLIIIGERSILNNTYIEMLKRESKSSATSITT